MGEETGPVTARSFRARASLPKTAPLATFLYQLIDTKKSNLCLSADVTSTAELLQLANQVGDSIAVLKTHADIITDFGESTIRGIAELSRRKGFLVFEDRKFGDIGSTVQKQYISGPLRIAQWAAIVNAHIFPGPAIIRALQSAAAGLAPPGVETGIPLEAGRPGFHGDGPPASRALDGDSQPSTGAINVETRGEARPLASQVNAGDSSAGPAADSPQPPQTYPPHRGLLLLAQMSSEGNLLTESYTKQCVQLARQHRDFVIGFVAQRNLNSTPDDNFITFTPGVSLPPTGSAEDAKLRGDGLGQQYNSPRHVVLDEGCDIIIVGRGILGAEDRPREAERYRQEAWRAYEDRLMR